MSTLTEELLQALERAGYASSNVASLHADAFGTTIEYINMNSEVAPTREVFVPRNA